jgi:hypothetical protein
VGDEADEQDVLAELERQDRAEQRCVCGHPRGLHVDDRALCLARLPSHAYCPCEAFRST